MNKIISMSTYKSYLGDVKHMIFKILPLYEEENLHLYEYIESISFEIYGLQELISELPHEFWYVKTLATLEAMKNKPFKTADKKTVKKEVFKILSAIDKQIEQLAD